MSMKPWAILAAALAGFAVERLTYRAPKAVPAPRPEAPALSLLGAPPVASGPVESAAPPLAPPAMPPARAATPRGRLLEKLWAHIDDDKLMSALWSAAQRDPKAQRDLFELIRTGDDPAFLEECARFLGHLKDEALLKEVLDLFASTPSRARLLALSPIIGAHWEREDVRGIVLEALGRDDAEVQERLLRYMCLQDLYFYPEEASSRIKSLIQGGRTEDVRVAAAMAMRGARRAPDIRFLVDVLLLDPSPRVQRAAMGAFRSHYVLPSGPEWSELVRVQARALYTAAIDGARDPALRKECAGKALQEAESLEGEGTLLNPGEIEALKQILGRKE